ncbi:MAG: acyl carrier protein [Rhodobacteraceae bacterium]|nr:MAG: acyl carrier protein [Paracoccaceae bacterium]
MQDKAIKDQISEFMAQAFSGAVIAHDQDIFEAGFGNSMFAMQLVNFVEVTFGIEVDSDDLDIDNFRSIDRVAALVQRKRAVAAA